MGADSEQGKKLGEQILQEYGVDCGVSIEEYGDRLIYGQEFMRVVPTIFDAGFQAGVESGKTAQHINGHDAIGGECQACGAVVLTEKCGAALQGKDIQK